MFAKNENSTDRILRAARSREPVPVPKTLGKIWPVLPAEVEVAAWLGVLRVPDGLTGDALDAARKRSEDAVAALSGG